MGKIICDVCGTTYPDTAERCPICGCTRDEAANMLGDELLMDELLSEPKANRQSAKKREIFDFDEANSAGRRQPQESESSYDEEELEEEPKQHTAVIVLLTALIALLLIAAAFLFFRFYLPGMGERNETTPPSVASTVQTDPTETTIFTEPTIPCESLVLISGTATGDAELTAPGQKFLINVHVSPEDTTDELHFVSADESIATVSEDGQVTAVGEGETIINIICGKMEMPCKVSCNFSKETEPPTEETTVSTEEATEPANAGLKDVELKLKKTDIRLKVYYEFQLTLDCDLEQSEVEWSCEHPYIAKVDEEGNVTALKSGTTSVTAKYGDQEVSCMIRCFD